MSPCSTATGSVPREGLTLISISALAKALTSLTQPGPCPAAVQPGAGSTETPGATSAPASATAGRLMAVSASVAVTAATIAMCRVARPNHRCGGDADVVVAPGVAKACMAVLLC